MHQSCENMYHVFDNHPEFHPSSFLKVALFFGVLWAISVLSFMVCYWLNSWSYVNPLALAVFMLVFLLNPTRTLKYRARFWLIKILVRRLSFCDYVSVRKCRFSNMIHVSYCNSCHVPVSNFYSGYMTNHTLSCYFHSV